MINKIFDEAEEAAEAVSKMRAAMPLASSKDDNDKKKKGGELTSLD